MIIFVTGSAGFIGFHVSKRLLERGDIVIGLDNFNPYYDVSLKEARNKILEAFPNFTLYRGDITDDSIVQSIFKTHQIKKVCHFAAQVGVRDSSTRKDEYLRSNIVGFDTVIEAAQQAGVTAFLYASSSSVYGDNPNLPFHEDDELTALRLSVYAETKRANEIIAHCYNTASQMKSVGVRFFTVYGPWGRPDMAMFSFAKKIIAGEEIQVFGDGSMMRDFTYIDDVVSGVMLILDTDPGCEILNIGRGEPVSLTDCVGFIEKHTGISAKKVFLPAPTEDTSKTHADITKARTILQYDPKVSLHDGIKHFIDWYKKYHNV